MADEQEQNAAETGSEDLQGTMPSIPVEAPEAPAPGPRKPRAGWSGALLLVAGLAVLLTIAGIFDQMKKEPNFMALGLGLLLWGVLDLIAQRRGLVVWKGAKAVVGNTVNLIRGLALLGVGAWLCLMAVGAMHRTNTAVLTDVCVFFLVSYLCVALLLEIVVKGVKLSGQAFLLAALALQFVSFLYFSLPFTFGWAAVFAGLAYASGAWAIFKDALEDSPALSRAVLTATLILGAPLATYTVQQMFFTVEQPLFTPTLLIPRMRQVVGGLSEDAAQIKWAPVHTHPGQPGDVPFSDKMAFTDYRDDEPGVGLFVQKEDKPDGELTWVDTGEEAQLTGFSEDGRLLAYSEVKEEGAAPRVAVMGPSGTPVSPWPADDEPDAAATAAAKKEPVRLKHKRLKKEKLEEKQAAASYTVNHPYAGSVAPGPDHNQVWRGNGQELYFASPEGAPKNGGSAVVDADLKGLKYKRVCEGRGLPAVSPDETQLLSVGFAPDVRYLEMADGAGTEQNPRVFNAKSERHYFPAWNASQTRVIFMDKAGKLHTMKSNGTDQHPFDPEALDSRLWLSDKTVPFTLQWKQSGDRWKIYLSDPQGRHEKLIYEALGKSISPPQWASDGKRIAFIVNNDEGSTVMSVSSDGKWPRRFYISKDPVRELRWSPDGLKLAWLVDRGDDSQEAWTASVDGMDPVKVFEGRGQLSSLSWAPGGKHLAFEEVKDWRFLGLRLVKPDLHIVQMVDLVDNTARVMTRYGLMSRQPSFSPQGVAIAYFTDYKPWSAGLLRDRASALVISQLY
jgi:Tol biopolymer transport system component